MTLSRVAERVPYVSYATRTGQRVLPHSRGSGSGRSIMCGLTVPADPAIETRDVITSLRIRETMKFFKTVGELGGIQTDKMESKFGVSVISGRRPNSAVQEFGLRPEITETPNLFLAPNYCHIFQTNSRNRFQAAAPAK